jgi:hypothetical protein
MWASLLIFLKWLSDNATALGVFALLPTGIWVVIQFVWMYVDKAKRRQFKVYHIY